MAQSLIRPPGTKPPEAPEDRFHRAKQPIPVRLICDGDLHYPIVDPRVEAAKLAFARDFRPDTWVNLGDLYDFWSISSHDKEVARWFTPAGLLQQEFDSAQPYWKEVTRIAKNVHFIPGNHENRLARLVQANMGLFGLRAFSWARLADIPQTVSVHEYGTMLDVGGVTFEHGDRLTGRFGTTHKAHNALQTRAGAHTIFGHTHTVQTHYKTVRDPRTGGNRTWVAHNQGHGSDVSKQGYAGTNPNWQHGFTAIEFYTVGGKPRFTIHPIVVLDGRFMWGGKLYDGRKTQ